LNVLWRAMGHAICGGYQHLIGNAIRFKLIFVSWLVDR
jgi:hypothetical protein